nr:Protein of unknown function DUF595 domain containing protein [Haemonchus contortus]
MAIDVKIAEKNRLIACAVEKNFSTMLTAILCYLFDERRFLESKRNLTTEVYHQRFCASKNEYSSLTEIEAKVTSSLHDWQKIAVNLKCFMERQYARLLKRATGVHSPVNFDDDHFSPQNWRCEFSTHLHDFQILHFDSSRPSGFTDSLLAVLKKNNADVITLIAQGREEGQEEMQKGQSMLAKNRLKLNVKKLDLPNWEEQAEAAVE